MESLIIPNAKINNFDNWLLEIKNITFVDEAIEAIKKIDLLKHALDAADTFRKQSVQFAILEANALIKIIELNGIEMLHGKRKDATKWLATLSDEDLKYYISLCTEGLTIDNLWWREFGKQENYERKISEISEMEDEIINELNSVGTVNLEKYKCEVEKKLGKKLASDVVDGMRNKLRQNGALGINDNTGTYIKLNVCENNKYAKEAIMERLRSITCDIGKLFEISHSVGDVTLTPSEIFGEPNCFNDNSGDFSYEEKKKVDKSFSSYDMANVVVIIILAVEYHLMDSSEAFRYMENLHYHFPNASTAKHNAKYYFERYIKYNKTFSGG